MQLPLIENDEEGWRDGDAGVPALRTEEDGGWWGNLVPACLLALMH